MGRSLGICRTALHQQYLARLSYSVHVVHTYSESLDCGTSLTDDEIIVADVASVVYVADTRLWLVTLTTSGLVSVDTTTSCDDSCLLLIIWTHLTHCYTFGKPKLYFVDL